MIFQILLLIGVSPYYDTATEAGVSSDEQAGNLGNEFVVVLYEDNITLDQTHDRVVCFRGNNQY